MHNKGVQIGRFFVGVARWVLLVLPACSVAAGTSAGSVCMLDRVDAEVLVDLVYDGDTFRTRRGDKIRLLGINTPELGHGKKPDQPLAKAAHRLLVDVLGRHPRVSLRYDLERRDRYQRTLAHVFLNDGSNVQQMLLVAGFATTLVVPPNEWSASCYAGEEAKARQRRQGVWALPAYQPVAAEDLEPSSRGFHIIQGSVQRIGYSAKNIWLDLTRDVAVRIPRSDLAMFRELDPTTLLGKRLEVRGWVQRRKGELRITVRHPAAIRLLR